MCGCGRVCCVVGWTSVVWSSGHVCCVVVCSSVLCGRLAECVVWSSSRVRLYGRIWFCGCSRITEDLLYETV